MKTGRLEAFSDGVLAIILTIMVLELKVPHEASEWSNLKPLVPVFFSYLLSFLYVAIYWNNHHHLLHATREVTGGIMWANMHLLFWLSLIPFVTGWMGENAFAPKPTTLYGVVLLMSGVAYTILSRAIMRREANRATLARALGRDLKGHASLILYGVGIATSFVSALAALAIYTIVAIIWLVPDRRIEKAMDAPTH